MLRQVATLFRYRLLIQSLVGRELKARYRGSLLGFFWSFINPLLLLLTYGLVFTYMLPVHRSADLEPYFLFLFCGILPWTWFNSSVLESSGVLIAGGNLIKKVLFPAEVLPIVSVLSNLVHFLLGLLILAGFMIGTQHFPDPGDLIFFPLVVIIQLIFTIALALILAALTVHFRDIRDLLANLLTFWFFATPIIYFYRMDSVQHFKWLFNINPFFHLSVSYQEILFFHDPFIDGHLKLLLVMGAASCVLFLFGYWLFDRLRDSFAEVV